ncbi:MAG: A/G-specific adenine glycosylase [Patulibacter minatonensis]
MPPARTATDRALDARRQELLLGWYADVGRDLPWRRTSDPYAVLVSEVMLQQTQVGRVVPRFEAWLERWPTVESLAAAAAGDVLAAWSGLGYNSRALRLHGAAKAIAEHGWPADEVGLRALPGIGPYTAAAVAAFALGQVAAAVDTNQARVIDRWDGASGRSAGALRTRALELVPSDAPDAWNHALMDLGATICTARTAACGRCPMADACASAGLVDPAAERAMRRSPVPRVRFEDTPRYVRGRIVAALVDAGPLGPASLAAAIPSEITHERFEEAVRGLVRDGLVVRAGDVLALPS